MDRDIAQEMLQWIITGVGINATTLLILGGIMGYLLIQVTRAVRDIASMTRETAFMIRQQYPDIDRKLQEIKDILEGR